MKNIALIAAFAALAIAGCGAKDEGAANTDTPTPTVVAYDLGSKKIGDMGICVICNAKEGTTSEEAVKETLDYDGKTYAFCSEAEKAEFISDPKKYTGK